MTTETLTNQRNRFIEVNTGIMPNAILVAEMDVFDPIVADYCKEHDLSCYPSSIILPGHPQFILS
jgi:hypothetical protein